MSGPLFVEAEVVELIGAGREPEAGCQIPAGTTGVPGGSGIGMEAWHGATPSGAGSAVKINGNSRFKNMSSVSY
ncbi:MAG: hypothetical protein COB96_05130 [Planctomycetota bacterium]|nr:MAG: hypothetical protein COB96_05130 [Planctomycetota bacterium]